MRKLAVVLSVAALAACGSSGSKAAAPSNETSPSSTTTSPSKYCQFTKQAALAATAVFYANSNGKYPTTFTELVDPENPLLMLPDEEEESGIHSELISPHTVESEDGWTLTMTGDGTRHPTFECS